VLDPQDPLTRKMTEHAAEEALAPARAAYDQVKASAAFTVQVAPLDSDVPKILEQWLRARE